MVCSRFAVILFCQYRNYTATSQLKENHRMESSDYLRDQVITAERACNSLRFHLVLVLAPIGENVICSEIISLVITKLLRRLRIKRSVD